MMSNDSEIQKEPRKLIWVDGPSETQVANALYSRYGRLPSAEEVFTMTYGSTEEKKNVWNFGIAERKE